MAGLCCWRPQGDDEAALLYWLDDLTLADIKAYLSAREGVRFEALSRRFTRMPIKRRVCLQMTARSDRDIELIVSDWNGVQIAVLRTSLAGIHVMFTRLLHRIRRFRTFTICLAGQFRLPLMTMRHLLAAAKNARVTDVRRFVLKFSKEYCHDSVEYFLPDWLARISPSVRHLQIAHSVDGRDVTSFVHSSAVARAIGGCRRLRSIDLIGQAPSTVGAAEALLAAAAFSLPHLHTLRIVGHEVPTQFDDQSLFPLPPPPASHSLTLTGGWLLSAVGSAALVHFVERVTGVILYLYGWTLLYTPSSRPSLMTSLEAVISSLRSSPPAVPHSVTVYFNDYYLRRMDLASLLPRWLQMAGRHRAAIALITSEMPDAEQFGAIMAEIEEANIAGLLPLPDYDAQQLAFRFNNGASVRLLESDDLI